VITCELIGRMGNQMFQIAATIALALDNNTKYKIPAHTLDMRFWPAYFHHLPTLNGEPIEHKYIEKDFSYSPIPFKENLCISGYFQSEKYFAHRRKEIIETFGISGPTKYGLVSIHIRRGDYLKLQTKHPVLPLAYYKEAISQFPNHKFLVFSDDVQWCKKIFHGRQFQFSEKRTPKEDMALMAMCEHNIIANSSFSWWGAWLNQNPDKKVVVPETWFGPGNAHLNTKDLIPETWQKLHLLPA
jgi:hypothetical protein